MSKRPGFIKGRFNLFINRHFLLVFGVILLLLMGLSRVHSARVRVYDTNGSDDECEANIKGVMTVTNGVHQVNSSGEFSVKLSLEKSGVGPNGTCALSVLEGGEVLESPGNDTDVLEFEPGGPGGNGGWPVGHSVTGRILIYGPKLKITSPEDGEKNFLVETREDGSIVRDQNEITISAKIKEKPDDFDGDITWTFDGDVDNDDESTEPGESATVGLTGEREESGRGQEPIEVDIRAEVTVNGERLEDDVTIEQIKGDPAYNVVRQEYEDVTGDVGAGGRDDAVTLPTANIFQEGTTDFPHALGTSLVPSLPNPNDTYDWYILNPNIIPGLEDAHDWAQNNRNFDVQYNYNSEYRSPTHNREIPGTGTGNSRHIYGTAVDFQVRFGSGVLVEPYYKISPEYNPNSGKNVTARAFSELLTSHGGAIRCLLEPSIGNPSVTKEVAHCEW